MEKAILKTLIYADIFDYPLKGYEIHKWLIEREASLRQVVKTLKKLNQESRIKNYGEYYFLPKSDSLVTKRKLREKQSSAFLLKIKVIAFLLKIIPWIKLVGVSGGLAMGNSAKSDDIDLFIITARGRLWLSRLLILGILSLTGQRRAVSHSKKEAAGKICCNILIDQDHLIQDRKDIYTAHEILQMKVVWERDEIYSKYLLDNEWAFKFLPNWVSGLSSPRRRGSNSDHESFSWIPARFARRAFAGMTLENLAKLFQLKIMKKSQGLERIEDGALYFHPQDCRPQVLAEYRQKLKKIISP